MELWLCFWVINISIYIFTIWLIIWMRSRADCSKCNQGGAQPQTKGFRRVPGRCAMRGRSSGCFWRSDSSASITTTRGWVSTRRRSTCCRNRKTLKSKGTTSSSSKKYKRSAEEHPSSTPYAGSILNKTPPFSKANWVRAPTACKPTECDWKTSHYSRKNRGLSKV